MKATRRSLKEAVSSLLSVFLFLALVPFSAFAQTETGQITVKAVDPQGAVVSGATVTAKSVERGTTATGKTNDDGIVTLTNLQPGVYDVTTTGSGFAPLTQKAQVTVGAKLTVEASLSPQAKSESVTI
ncbi:MAG: carboxypeptidase regulatory-like domain-containing protein, partial [Acidobacteria bacterium]|nr:carboxypeptidase regulatory-like domain-containing protein [Acidobacteriota bacterium]